MTDLVEKVQRAILGENASVMFGADPEKQGSTFEREARAAIAAVLDELMEPTAKQIESARYSFWVGVPDDVSDTDAAKIALQVYIAAKRKELNL